MESEIKILISFSEDCNLTRQTSRTKQIPRPQKSLAMLQGCRYKVIGDPEPVLLAGSLVWPRQAGPLCRRVETKPWPQPRIPCGHLNVPGTGFEKGEENCLAGEIGYSPLHPSLPPSLFLFHLTPTFLHSGTNQASDQRQSVTAVQKCWSMLVPTIQIHETGMTSLRAFIFL